MKARSTKAFGRPGRKLKGGSTSTIKPASACPNPGRGNPSTKMDSGWQTECYTYSSAGNRASLSLLIWWGVPDRRFLFDTMSIVSSGMGIDGRSSGGNPTPRTLVSLNPRLPASLLSWYCTKMFVPATADFSCNSPAEDGNVVLEPTCSDFRIGNPQAIGSLTVHKVTHAYRLSRFRNRTWVWKCNGSGGMRLGN